MGLDIRTLFVVDVAVLLMTAAVSFTLWFQHRDIAGLLWWSFATAAEGLAMLIARPSSAPCCLRHWAYRPPSCSSAAS
jgi:hypothetical protein